MCLSPSPSEMVDCNKGHLKLTYIFYKHEPLSVLILAVGLLVLLFLQMEEWE